MSEKIVEVTMNSRKVGRVDANESRLSPAHRRLRTSVLGLQPADAIQLAVKFGLPKDEAEEVYEDIRKHSLE